DLSSSILGQALGRSDVNKGNGTPFAADFQTNGPTLTLATSGEQTSSSSSSAAGGSGSTDDDTEGLPGALRREVDKILDQNKENNDKGGPANAPPTKEPPKKNEETDPEELVLSSIFKVVSDQPTVDPSNRMQTLDMMFTDDADDVLGRLEAVTASLSEQPES